MEMQKPVFFRSLDELHNWFRKNHNKMSEVWIGFYKVSSGKKSVGYKKLLMKHFVSDGSMVSAKVLMKKAMSTGSLRVKRAASGVM